MQRTKQMGVSTSEEEEEQKKEKEDQKEWQRKEYG
jgi:hypothetical protein